MVLLGCHLGRACSQVREWLATNPGAEQLQEVFKELSARDKGAAKAIRERMEEMRRAKGQEAIAAEWAEKAEKLLGASKLNIADALAWQRDAAKAGAPLSREPLAALKIQLADRIKTIEDLQHRVQVQREAAVLLAQRVEVLSPSPTRMPGCPGGTGHRCAALAGPSCRARRRCQLGQRRSALPEHARRLQVAAAAGLGCVPVRPQANPGCR
ncbi:hypothetical protein [Comamonas sp. JC664]|uniref:hypothetical protein n=1 Tax=Comamonas sp. JC664 TaxID=2801917 RepID=UPI00366D63B4